MEIVRVGESFFVKFKLPVESSEFLETSFRSFLEKPEQYRREFLQNNAPGKMEGYSYMGQTDSRNQSSKDLLHSFVLSDSYGFDFFPDEFQNFLDVQWEPLTSKVRELERKLLSYLGFTMFDGLYNEHIDYLLSCNYYPAVNNSKIDQDYGLFSHKDISLFTTFVFGNRKGFSYDYNGRFLPLDSVAEVIIFPGYFLEFISQGAIKALEHRVELTDQTKERFSFAFFSILAPKKDFSKLGISVVSEDYYESYLSLF